MTNYPLPAAAASAWIAGDKLWLGFPPLSENDNSHSVAFSIDLGELRAQVADGNKALRGTLLALEALKARNDHSTVGTRGSPTQHDIMRAEQNKEFLDKWLIGETERKERLAAEKAEAKEFLAGLGL